MLDVFLTTMKPQEKVVTAQDIESSLYYVHVDSEKDAELLRLEEDDKAALLEEDEEDIGPFTAQECKNIVHRKPVLPPRRPTQELETRPQAHPHLQSPSFAPRVSASPGRKPVGQGSSKPGHKSTELGSMFAHRKMLGPRPMHDRLHSVGSAALEDVPQRQNTNTRRWSEQAASLRPPFPLRPHEQKLRDLDELYRANSTYSNGRPPSMEDSRSTFSSESYDVLSGQQPASESSLTLIRRYDYLQSNVGKIMASNLPSDPVKLDIMGLGYSKFNTEENGSQKSTSLEEQEQAAYRCHLHDTTTTSARRPTHDFQVESHGSPIAHTSGLRGSLDLRRRSHLSSNSFEPVSNHKPAPTKGYTFQSPWKGTCEFVTGVAGRSLKCRHSHPSRYGQATEVSELRFNLPSSKTFTPARKSSAPGTPRESKRSSFFSKNHRRQDSFESIEGPPVGSFQSKIDLEDRLDLSLGQEHAGGGFGGKQAKLGKLIIEQEGLQMLDLIVAANMALWWRVYDRMV